MTFRNPRRLLLAGVSATALLAAAPVRAGTPAQFSTQFYAALAGVQRSAGALAGARPAGFGLTQSAQSTANIANLTARLARASAAQSAAAAIAFSHPTRFVPDGLTTGGLQLAPNPTLATRFGAAAPTQGSANGRTIVTVNQTAEQALLTWRTFNVGAHTTLTFNQPNQSAMVLNQISDPAANPSVILGQIGANGRVYILNPNGILFGAGAQVNVGGLVASSGSLNASFGSAAQFLTGSGGGTFGLYGAVDSKGVSSPTFTGATAPVTVETGASIQTPPSPRPILGGGLVLLHGGTVTNDGSIATPSGQTILAAGRDLIVRGGLSTTGNPTSTVFGTEAAVAIGGSVTNGGIVTATLGDVTLVGRAVAQAGVLLTTTSVGQTEQGTIHLLTDLSDATGIVTLAPGSVTVIAPDAKPETAPDSTRTSQITNSLANDGTRTTVGLNDLSILADRRDLSLLQITTGGAVDFAAGSLTMAQGGQVNVDSQTRALVEHGASIDVSGVGTAVVPQSINVVSLRIETSNLSDNPISRGATGLGLSTVDIDTRNLISIATGAYSGIDYTGGGALLVPAAVAQGNGHGIDEWLSVGGTVTLSSHVIATQTGSSINLAGGAIRYAAGAVPQSYLIGADGRVYDINTAPEAIRYVGIYDGFQSVHPRWSVTDVYNNPLITPPSLNEPGYVVGRDGGALVVAAVPTKVIVTKTDATGNKTATTVIKAPTVLLDGSVNSGVILGALQVSARAAGITDGYSQPQNAVPLAGSITIGGPIGINSYIPNGVALYYLGQATLTNDVVFGAGNMLADAITKASRIPAADVNPIALNVAALTVGGLGGLTVETSGSVGVNADVNLSPGGSLVLVGSTIDVTAKITTRGGRVSLGNTPVPVPTGLFQPFTGKHGATLVLGPTATIDLRGEFSNGRLDGLNSSGLGFLNGGTVTLASSRLTLSPGSLIDVSAGYGIRDTGRAAGGTGGSVSVLGNIVFATTVDVGTTVDLGGTIRGYGVTGGGTLTVQADRVQIGTSTGAARRGTLVLDPSLFDTGFQSYVVNAGRTLSVADGTTIAPVVPTLTAGRNTPLSPTGDDPLQALQLTLLPLYTQNTRTAQLMQRPGASLALDASTGSIQPTPTTRAVPIGAVSIGAGARITIDPLQSLRVQSAGQLTVDGTLTAHGGTVSLLNTLIDGFDPTFPVSVYSPGVSIWLGSASRIDVSGSSASALDSVGRSYGLVSAGGSVVIGAPGDAFASTTTPTTDAVVIARQGSIVDASGASLTVDPMAGTAAANVLSLAIPILAGRTIETTGGGTIQVASADGLFLEGAMNAPSGGTGALGGALSVALSANSTNSPRAGVNVLSVVASSVPLLSPTLQIGKAVRSQLIGTAQIGVNQITAGGFGTVALVSLDNLSFTGSVTLRAANSVTLQGSLIGDSLGTGNVSVSAPVVNLVGFIGITGLGGGGSPTGKTSLGTMTVAADLVRASGLLALDFGQLNIDSTGDIRFGQGSLRSGGNIDFSAAQLSPETFDTFSVGAGLATNTSASGFIFGAKYSRTGTITVHGTGVIPPMPGSVDGSLTLVAATIDQGGVVRAPGGQLTLGNDETITGSGKGTNYPTLVRFEPGSVTSVGLDGAHIPFGGTPDGQTYNEPFGTPGLLYPLTRSINVTGRVIDIMPSATIDISGGGELIGAGFIGNGRGGSVNVLTTPTIAFNPTARTITTPSLAATPVYAIIPGYTGAYAPDQPNDATGDAVVPTGQQITIAGGVPGLPAGTYTVLPASYALLPGAFRVQLGATEPHVLQPSVAQPDGAFTTTATLGTANTGTTAALPISVLLSSGSVTRQLSSYDEESFSQFLVGQAALTGKPRAPIAADAGLLVLTLPSPPSTEVAQLVNLGTLESMPALGGYGGTVDLIAYGVNSSGSQAIEIVGPGVAPTKGFVSLQAAAVDAFGAQGLTIQGDIIAIRSATTLDAGQIVLNVVPNAVNSGITIESGATLSTLGQGVSVYSDPYSAAFLAVAGGASEALQSIQINGTYTFSGVTKGGNVSIAAGAAVLTQGTLSAAAFGALSVDPAAVFGARYISLAANDINIGTVASIAAASRSGTLPTGLVLSQQLLTTLLAGDPALGTPALQTLTLVANSQVNLFGSVSLSTLGANDGAGLQNLELSTPAIYGAGTAGDIATIATGTLYLSGLQTYTTQQQINVYSTALPGAPVAGGPGFGLGTLNIVANDIVLGTGPGTIPNYPTAADRLIEGFSTVNLTATDRITSNNDGALNVFAQPGTIYGAHGKGGALNLTTPLLTAGPATQVAFEVGGALTLSSGGGAAVSGPSGYGGQITMTADSVALDSAVVLPGGRFAVTAAHDISLAGTIDLSAANVAFFDQVRGVPGGTATLESTGGSVLASAGSTIAFGSAGTDAGALQLTAMAGTVDFAGMISGTAGSLNGVAGLGGMIDARAGTLADLNGLNARLNAGGVDGARTLEIGSGNVTLTGPVIAGTIDISADAGSLIVNGTLDASGTGPGRISLAAHDGLTVAAGSLLDVHETVLHTDFYGGVIAAENTGHVSLTSVAGTVAIGGGTTIDAGSPDGVSRGVLTLNAPRVGANDIAVAVPQPVTLTGVTEADIVGWRNYTAGTQIGTAIAGAADTVEVAQADFNKIDKADTRPFMTALLASEASGGAIARDTAGLIGTTVNLRPGVAVTTTGTLVVGDSDLHTYRYGGQPGVLRLRAAGNLVFNGSLTDGFGTVPQGTKGNPDNQGWIVYNSASEPYRQTIVVPEAFGGQIGLDAGTTIPNSLPGGLNYAIPVASGQTLNANVVIPQAVTLDDIGSPYTFAIQYTATADILSRTGTVIFARGTLIQAGATLRAGDQLAAGSVLPFQVQIKSTMWNAGESLTVFAGAITLGSIDPTGNNPLAVTLPGGALLPAGSTFIFDANSTASTVNFVDGSTAVDLRAPNTAGQGLIYATAPLLSGLSWSYDLISGANLASADGTGVQAASVLGGGGGTVLADTHFTTPYLGLLGTIDASGTPTGVATPSFSVIRTGTGGITLASGGSVTEDSFYGLYTAGAATVVLAAYQPARATDSRGYPTVLGPSTGAPNRADYNQLIAGSAFNYPDGGGDLTVRAQGNITGAAFLHFSTSSIMPGAIANWLLLTGVQGVSGVVGQPAAWAVNFGTYMDIEPNYFGATPSLVGFSGIGTLGGGNLSVVAGASAGDVPGTGYVPGLISNGLNPIVLAVGGTGRVTSVATEGATVLGGRLTETGGGSLTFRVAGSIIDGLVTDIRGPISVAAGAIGQAGGSKIFDDPRPVNPYAPNYSIDLPSQITGFGSLIVTPGDGPVRIASVGDQNVSFDDPGQLPPFLQNGLIDAATMKLSPALATTNFSLWTPVTTISEIATGGNLSTNASLGSTTLPDLAGSSGFEPFVPSSLDAAAASGSVLGVAMELAPSAHGNLDLLAQGTIESVVAEISGAGYGPNDIPNPFKPLFNASVGNLTLPGIVFRSGAVTNATAPNVVSSLFAFEPDTASASGHAADGVAQHVYAVTGDILDVTLGTIINLGPTAITPNILYVGSTSAIVRAGQDIVNFGRAPTSFGIFFSGLTVSGDLILNRAASDASVLSAGRDIIQSSVTIAGPGVLSVEAGRNLDQTSTGQLQSIGPVYSIDPLNRDTGASIAVTVGAGAAGPDYAALEAAYLNPDAVALPGINLGTGANTGRVAADYVSQLLAFLQTTYSYGGDANGARAFFDTLGTEQKNVFLRQVYFDELVASGREETDTAGVRFGSYARGKQAISILFPAGQSFGGDYTAFSAFNSNTGTLTDAGISTSFGGNIQLLVPGGQIILGEGTTAPGPGTGLLTRGSGDIDAYSTGSILLDLSRVFTTFGGSVALWSAQGNISAGNGAQSTLIFSPPSITYDTFGGISVAPSVPSSGAGIATLAPIPGVPAGNVDLIAPSGTIDAGEAGIRVSGNLNLAALVVANAANIAVSGKTTGAPTVAVANVGALAAAGAAAGAATNEAQQAAQRQSAARPQSSGSLITVEVVSNGG